MKSLAATLAILLVTASASVSAQPPAGVPSGTPLRGAVQAGDTLYVSGSLDLDAQGNVGKTAEESAHLALDGVKKNLEANGFTMDDLVQVTVFCTDLSYFADFNKVYVTYFKNHDKMPARAFIGAGSLLRGGHFEVMGIAVKGHK
jgi:2-iminobutanoate/2-iminopropanoate deaminase